MEIYFCYPPLQFIVRTQIIQILKRFIRSSSEIGEHLLETFSKYSTVACHLSLK